MELDQLQFNSAKEFIVGIPVFLRFVFRAIGTCGWLHEKNYTELNFASHVLGVVAEVRGGPSD